MVETIWQGNVCEFSRAYDLICVVDQIHEFALTQHRDFVIKHIEPWLKRSEEGIEETTRDADEGSDTMDVDFDSCHLDMPEWRNLKEDSKDMRSEKRMLSRCLKRKRAMQQEDDLQSDKSGEDPEASGQRQQNEMIVPPNPLPAPKRGRGRPRKTG